MLNGCGMGVFSPHTRETWVGWKQKQKRRKRAKGEQRNERANETRSGEPWSIRRAHLYGMHRRVNPGVPALRRKLFRTALRLAASFPLLSTQPGMALHKEEREAGEQEVVAYPYEDA